MGKHRVVLARAEVGTEPAKESGDVSALPPEMRHSAQLDEHVRQVLKTVARAAALAALHKGQPKQ